MTNSTDPVLITRWQQQPIREQMHQRWIYKVAKMYYVDLMTQSEIATRLHITPIRVSRLIQEGNARKAAMTTVTPIYPASAPTSDHRRRPHRLRAQRQSVSHT
ncbi:hypothetical protein [Serinibacter arcticus]|uniref:hypothetical protein n=1 Tax=Serinibacter arcticus TaxID=1655435 RepID=UPI001092C336|nr:hypothetical protein [Serinibacter arcticus]